MPLGSNRSASEVAAASVGGGRNDLAYRDGGRRTNCLPPQTPRPKRRTNIQYENRFLSRSQSPAASSHSISTFGSSWTSPRSSTCKMGVSAPSPRSSSYSSNSRTAYPSGNYSSVVPVKRPPAPTNLSKSHDESRFVVRSNAVTSYTLPPSRVTVSGGRIPRLHPSPSRVIPSSRGRSTSSSSSSPLPSSFSSVRSNSQPPPAAVTAPQVMY